MLNVVAFTALVWLLEAFVGVSVLKIERKTVFLGFLKVLLPKNFGLSFLKARRARFEMIIKLCSESCVIKLADTLLPA